MTTEIRFVYSRVSSPSSGQILIHAGLLSERVAETAIFES